MTIVTTELIDAWANDAEGPVALHLKQKLVSVEGEGAVIFPPTYADIGYNIDTLSDGTKVVTIDSVGAQANRIEPIFGREKLKHLVPQINITYLKNDKTGSSLSLLEAGHRLGDAVIRSTELHEKAQKAFKAFQTSNDPTELAKLGPTSLVFGVWDSRDTNAKLPRIVQSVIRAWNVDPLKRSAQFNPALDYAALKNGFTDDEKKKAEGDAGNPLAVRGFVHVPATETHGGVVVHGDIVRDVTVNLVALRRLGSKDHEKLRRYILGLSLVAAVEPPEAFLRQGCLLVPDEKRPARWQVVDRHGKRSDLSEIERIAQEYAKAAAITFVVGDNETVAFDPDKAKDDVKKADKKADKKAKASSSAT